MSSIFSVQKPKHFERQPRFGNERKEYIEQRKRQIMREEGLLPMEKDHAEELIRGKFFHINSLGLFEPLFLGFIRLNCVYDLLSRTFWKFLAVGQTFIEM